MAQLIIFFLRVMGWLPLPVVHALAYVLYPFVRVLAPKSMHVIKRNLAACYPDMSEKERNVLSRRALLETLKTITEFGAIWFAPVPRVLAWVKEVQGQEVLDRAMAKNKGVLLSAPHDGAWEMVGLYCAAQYPMSSLYKRPRIDGLDDMMRTARQRTGAALVATDAGGIRQLFKALKAGQLVGILPDQEPKEGGGVFAPFMGVPALTMTLFPRLIQKSGAPVVYAIAERLTWGRGYRMHFIPGPKGMDEKTPELAATALNQGVEACVGINPAQYQWAYKRFSMRPDGAEKIY